MARRARVPPVVVALTVVALGTSLPELVVALQAAFSGYPGILLGNVVGSNVANVLIVGGLTAVVYPLAQGEDSVRRDAALMMAFSVVFALLAVFGTLGRGSGLVLLTGLALVLFLAGRDATRAQSGTDRSIPLEWVLGLPTSSWLIGVLIGAGIVGLPVGARLVVDAAVDIATRLGVSETVVGLTIIAFSTSLPELATTVVAAYRRRTDVVLGTIVGSNIMNLVAIMGLAAVISPDPVPVPGRFAAVELPLMLGSAGILATYIWMRKPVGRLSGALLCFAYGAYVSYLFLAG